MKALVLVLIVGLCLLPLGAFAGSRYEVGSAETFAAFTVVGSYSSASMLANGDITLRVFADEIFISVLCKKNVTAEKCLSFDAGDFVSVRGGISPAGTNQAGQPLNVLIATEINRVE